MKTMGFRKLITLSLSTVCALSLSSCFKDEPLNAECDIEQAYIHAGSWLKLWFTNASDTLVNVQSDQDKIEFTMKPFASLKKQAPMFRLTPGATIQPESGSVQDFSKGPVTYVVTSEDKQWTRKYQVSIKKGQTTMSKEFEFDFENAYLSKGYYNWQENWNGGNRKPGIQYQQHFGKTGGLSYRDDRRGLSGQGREAHNPTHK